MQAPVACSFSASKTFQEEYFWKKAPRKLYGEGDSGREAEGLNKPDLQHVCHSEEGEENPAGMEQLCSPRKYLLPLLPRRVCLGATAGQPCKGVSVCRWTKACFSSGVEWKG